VILDHRSAAAWHGLFVRVTHGVHAVKPFILESFPFLFDNRTELTFVKSDDI
jgi:hypothetical protein